MVLTKVQDANRQKNKYKLLTAAAKKTLITKINDNKKKRRLATKFAKGTEGPMTSAERSRKKRLK